MYRKQLFISFIAAAVLLCCAAAAAAQVGTLRGKVTLKQADGTDVPVAGASIDVYRTDIAGKWNTKTNKSGEFVFAGLPYSGTYIIAASAPNTTPKVLSDVKAGREVEYELNLVPGDGKRFSEAEAKKAATAATPPAGGGESEADKAKREELERKNREISAKNSAIENVNTLYQEAYKSGTAAIKAGDFAANSKQYDEAITKYTEAITKYDEALNADPEHPGAPVLLTNKAGALKGRGVVRYNRALGIEGDQKTVGIKEAQQDFKDAAAAAKKAVDFIKAQTAPVEPTELSRYNQSKYFALSALAESLRLVVSKADPGRADEGVQAYDEYLAVETNPDLKLKGQLAEAQMLFDGGATDRSVVLFQKVLETNPDNIEALLGAGLALFSSGDKDKYQEAANYLQRFVDKAPDTHQFKADAKAVLEELKKQDVKPQKPGGGRRRG